MRHIRLLLLFGIIFFISSILSAQETDSVKQNSLPKIYLQCDECDLEYTKNHLSFVNYVRERLAADIHVLVTGSDTGSGGIKVLILFYGQL